jgi:hypothetical protein
MEKKYIIFIIIGIGSMIVGVYAAAETLDFLNRAVTTEAIVVDYVKNPYGDGNTYCSVFQFTDINGEEVYRRSAGGYSSNLLPEIGEKVEIYYDPEDNRGTAYAGTWELWGNPLIYGLGGLAITSVTIIIYKKRR